MPSPPPPPRPSPRSPPRCVGTQSFVSPLAHAAPSSPWRSTPPPPPPTQKCLKTCRCLYTGRRRQNGQQTLWIRSRPRSQRSCERTGATPRRTRTSSAPSVRAVGGPSRGPSTFRNKLLGRAARLGRGLAKRPPPGCTEDGEDGETRSRCEERPRWTGLVPAPVAAPEVVAVAAPVPVPLVLAGQVLLVAAVAEFFVTDPIRKPHVPAATLPALDASRAAARVRCQGYARALQANSSHGTGAAI